MRVGAKKASGLSLALAFLGLGGCDIGSGDDATVKSPIPLEPGSLAQHVPAGTDLYFEVIVRPQEELQNDVAASLEAIGESFEGADEQTDESLEVYAEQLPLKSGVSLDYEEDLKPWLGERVAAFASVADDPQLIDAAAEGEVGSDADAAIDGAVALTVTDADAAAEAIDRVTDSSLEVEREEALRYVEGAIAEHDLALTENTLVIGDPPAVDAALSAHESGSLAEERWFRIGVGDVETDALGFFVGLSESLMRINLARSGPNFAERYGDQLVDKLSFEPDEPFSAKISTTDDGFALDTVYPLRNESPLNRAAAQVRELPADSFLALADPAFVPATIHEFALGVEIGLARRPNYDPVPKLGYDPVSALDLLRPPATVFALEDPASGSLVAGMSIAARESRGVTRAPDALRFASSALGATSIKPLDGDFYEFIAELPGLPEPIEVREGKEHVTVTMAPSASARQAAAEPEETLATSGKLDRIAEAVGDGYTPLGFLEIGPAINALEGVPGLLPPLPAPSDAVQESRVDLGGRTDGKRFVLRYVLSR